MKHPAMVGSNVKFVVADDKGANCLWNTWENLMPSLMVVQTVDPFITRTIKIGMIDSKSIYNRTGTHFIGEHAPVFAVL